MSNKLLDFVKRSKEKRKKLEEELTQISYEPTPLIQKHSIRTYKKNALFHDTTTQVTPKFSIRLPSLCSPSVRKSLTPVNIKSLRLKPFLNN